MEEGVLKETDFRLDHFPADYDKERIARTLAPLNHLQNLEEFDPRFCDLYGNVWAETFEDLQVSSRWKKERTLQEFGYADWSVWSGMTLFSSICMKKPMDHMVWSQGRLVQGSQKPSNPISYPSLLTSTLMMWLSCWLTIRGGGMANLFKTFPISWGRLPTWMVPNLCGPWLRSMRRSIVVNDSLESSKSTISINTRRSLKTGEGQNRSLISSLSQMSSQSSRSTSPTLSRSWYLSRVSDVPRCPLDPSNSKKPSGVVDDQIWSNSRFKIALKVADRSDSNEMLHTPDAAEITQTGRAYLQVGNNEVYEFSSQPGQARITSRTRTIWGLRTIPST